MNIALRLAAGLLAGGVVGAVYFQWLGWTLQGLVDGSRSGPWFALNVVARFAFALAGFGLVAHFAGWLPLVAALAGFIVARIVLLRRLTGPARDLERPS